MKADAPPGPECPYCSARIPSWPQRLPVYGCTRCRRPLYLYPVRIARPQIYKIKPLFQLAKQLTAIAALWILIVIFLNFAAIQTVFCAVILTFFVHGSMDLADGYLGYKTSIDRTWNKLTPSGQVKLRAAMRMAGGGGLVVLAIFGVASILV
ncbi:MAG: hypothetical protein EBR34_08645 [Sphingomonadaceae bacterium]|nr:hypothetical protein [Sphingomonadaceae bacterium]